MTKHKKSESRNPSEIISPLAVMRPMVEMLIRGSMAEPRCMFHVIDKMRGEPYRHWFVWAENGIAAGEAVAIYNNWTRMDNVGNICIDG